MRLTPRTLLLALPLLLAALGAVAFVLLKPDLAFPRPRFTRTVITWTPGTLSAEIALAETRTVSVAFTSRQDLRRAAVELSPALVPLIRTDRTLLEHIRKGQRYQLGLVLSPAQGASPGAVSGTILLRSVPEPAADAGGNKRKTHDKAAAATALTGSLSVQLLVTVVPLPPDPGTAGTATLEGIDADSDGVRDDAQRYIALTFPQSAKTRAALTQQAVTLQAALRDANDQSASTAHGRSRVNAMDCLAYVLGTTHARSVFSEFRAQFLNTKERSVAYITADSHLAGQIYELPEQLKTGCSFDPDAMEN